eukprot:9121941-Alexandrium_andersonii.AAC.1
MTALAHKAFAGGHTRISSQVKHLTTLLPRAQAPVYMQERSTGFLASSSWSFRLAASSVFIAL